MSDLYNFLDGTLIGRVMGGRSQNNKYISQPNFTYAPLSFQQSEQWVTITGNERNIYNTTAPLKTVIDRMALMYANGIWEHVDKDGNIIENSDFVKLLENPNVFQSSKEFLFQWYIQRSVYSGTFMFNLYGSSLQEIPTALWNLSPSRMTIHRTGKIWRQTELEDIISGYTFKTDSSTNDNFETNEIIQFSMPDSDDPIIGHSPFEAVRMEISNIRAALGYSNTILTKKGGIGVWSSDAKDTMGSITLTTDEEKKLSDQLVRNYGIGDHQSSIAISSKALKWNPSTYPTKDLMLFETIDAGLMAIIDLYGGNKNMFASGSKDSTFENVSMGERQAYQNTLIPIGQDMGNGLAKRWGLLDKGETLRLNYDHVAPMKEDEAAKAAIIKTKAEAVAILRANGMNPNDIISFD
jgi:hypothetical protein